MRELYNTLASLGEELAIRGTYLLDESEKISELLKIIENQEASGRKQDAKDTAKFLPEPWRTVKLRKFFNHPDPDFFPTGLLATVEKQIDDDKYVQARFDADYLPEPMRTCILHKILKKQILNGCFINNIRATARIILR